MPDTTPDGLPLRGVLFNRDFVSLCDRRVNVVLPRRFDLGDPAACVRCVEEAGAGVLGQEHTPA
jgi:hypothetical protein